MRYYRFTEANERLPGSHDTEAEAVAAYNVAGEGPVIIGIEKVAANRYRCEIVEGFAEDSYEVRAPDVNAALAIYVAEITTAAMP